MQTRVYASDEIIVFDTIGETNGSDISFTPTSGSVTLAGGKAYLAIFEGAVDLVGDVGGSAIGLFLNGVSIGGSGIATMFNRAPDQPGSKSITSPVVFKTQAGATSTLTARFGQTDPTRLVGPVLNVVTLRISDKQNSGRASFLRNPPFCRDPRPAVSPVSHRRAR